MIGSIYIADWHDGTLHFNGFLVFLVFALPILAWLSVVIAAWFGE